MIVIIVIWLLVWISRNDNCAASPQARRSLASGRQRLRRTRRRQGRGPHLPSGGGCARGPPLDVGERPRRAHQARSARLRGDTRGGNGGVREELAREVVSGALGGPGPSRRREGYINGSVKY